MPLQNLVSVLQKLKAKGSIWSSAAVAKLPYVQVLRVNVEIGAAVPIAVLRC